MRDYSSLKNLILMLGYNHSCSKILLALIEEPDYVDVRYICEKTGYSRSMVSYIMKMLEKNGILMKKREGHKFVYSINKKFLLNIYNSFINRLDLELKQLSMENLSNEIYEQINLIKNGIKNLKGEFKWQTSL